jgi:hypothetical protein
LSRGVEGYQLSYSPTTRVRGRIRIRIRERKQKGKQSDKRLTPSHLDEALIQYFCS